MPNVKLIKNKNGYDSEMGFIFEGLPISYLNSIRRFCHDIPTWCLEVTSINKTGIDTPIISERIGYIPIRSEMAENADPEVVFTGIAENLKDDKKEFLAKHLIPSDKREGYFSEDNILIMTLFTGKSIEITAKLVKGTNQENSKWCPVAPCRYRFLPNEDNIPETNPDGTPNYDKILQAESNFIKDKDGFNKVEIIMEAKGQLPAIEIWHKTIPLILENLNLFKDAIVNDNNEIISYNPGGESNSYTIWDCNFTECDHSIAGIISEEIDKHPTCKYSSYRTIHPLNNSKKIIFAISSPNVKEVIEYGIDKAIENCQKINKMIMDQMPKS